MKKINLKKKIIFYALYAIVIGYLFSGFAGKSLFKRETYRTVSDNVEVCTESDDICKSGLVPKYTVGASAGKYGFPFMTSSYYCLNDDTCVVTTYYKLAGPIKMEWLNVALWSAFFYGLILAGDSVISKKRSKS